MARSQSKYMRERYELMVKLNMCPICGEYAYGNHVLCPTCREKKREYMAVHRKRDNARIKGEERRKRLMKSGRCAQCGKEDAKNGHTLCQKCLDKKKFAQRRYRSRDRNDIPRSERASYGICYQCGKYPVIQGKKLCKECYEKMAKVAEKGRSSRKSINGFHAGTTVLSPCKGCTDRKADPNCHTPERCDKWAKYLKQKQLTGKNIR